MSLMPFRQDWHLVVRGMVGIHRLCNQRFAIADVAGRLRKAERFPWIAAGLPIGLVLAVQMEPRPTRGEEGRSPNVKTCRRPRFSP